jgi:hypothetical protein
MFDRSNPGHISNAPGRTRLVFAAGFVIGMVGFIVAVPCNATWVGAILAALGCLAMVYARWLADRQRRRL